TVLFSKASENWKNGECKQTELYLEQENQPVYSLSVPEISNDLLSSNLKRHFFTGIANGCLSCWNWSEIDNNQKQQNQSLREKLSQRSKQLESKWKAHSSLVTSVDSFYKSTAERKQSIVLSGSGDLSLKLWLVNHSNSKETTPQNNQSEKKYSNL